MEIKLEEHRETLLLKILNCETIILLNMSKSPQLVILGGVSQLKSFSKRLSPHIQSALHIHRCLYHAISNKGLEHLGLGSLVEGGRGGSSGTSPLQIPRDCYVCFVCLQLYHASPLKIGILHIVCIALAGL